MSDYTCTQNQSDIQSRSPPNINVIQLNPLGSHLILTICQTIPHYYLMNILFGLANVYDRLLKLSANIYYNKVSRELIFNAGVSKTPIVCSMTC